jgi:hypothetical protein
MGSEMDHRKPVERRALEPLLPGPVAKPDFATARGEPGHFSRLRAAPYQARQPDATAWRGVFHWWKSRTAGSPTWPAQARRCGRPNREPGPPASGSPGIRHYRHSPRVRPRARSLAAEARHLGLWRNEWRQRAGEFLQRQRDACCGYFIASRISPAAAMALSTSRERAFACWVAWVRSPRTAATPAERSRSRSNRTFCMASTQDSKWLAT